MTYKWQRSEGRLNGKRGGIRQRNDGSQNSEATIWEENGVSKSKEDHMTNPIPESDASPDSLFSVGSPSSSMAMASRWEMEPLLLEMISSGA